jgi:hypothetical protein
MLPEDAGRCSSDSFESEVRTRRGLLDVEDDVSTLVAARRWPDPEILS